MWSLLQLSILPFQYKVNELICLYSNKTVLKIESWPVDCHLLLPILDGSLKRLAIAAGYDLGINMKVLTRIPACGP